MTDDRLRNRAELGICMEHTISPEILIEHPSVGLTSLAQLNCGQPTLRPLFFPIRPGEMLSSELHVMTASNT